MMIRSFLLVALMALAQAFSPEVTFTKQNEMSNDLLYFDDAPVVLNLNDEVLYRSDDSGKTWSQTLEEIRRIFVDPLKKERAFAFTQGNTHYVTNDRGATWNKVKVPINADFVFTVNVNSKNTDQVIVPFYDCDEHGECKMLIYYTTDGFKSDPTILVKDVAKCIFTESNGVFDSGKDEIRILCLKTDRDSNGRIRRSEVISSTDFFLTEPQVINDASGVLAGSYVLDIRVVQSFIVAVVQGDKFDISGSSVFLYVSKDGINFNRAVMTETLVSGGLQFLDSTKDSLHIAVTGLDSSGPISSSILVSDSEGVHFRNMLSNVGSSGMFGFLDIDKIETIEGVWVARILEGYDSGSYLPKSRSKITFDDGNTWNYMKTATCEGDENCGLNILSLEERKGNGQTSTGSTPGILLAIGNEGQHLDNNTLNLHTYVSRDGGWTWAKALEEPCIFSFGDLGNVIVAAPYKKDASGTVQTNKIYYSLDQGSTWEVHQLEQEVFPTMLSTAIDDTSANFIYVGLQEGQKTQDVTQLLYSLDFSKAFTSTCRGSDFEKWYGRSMDGNDGTCIFGHKDIYKRRKADAKCFVNKVFEDLKVEEVPCTCSEADYECSFGFSLNSKSECVPDRAALKILCGSDIEKELNLQIKRKIPGNMCEGGDVKIDEFTFACNDDLLKTESITTSEFKFDGGIVNYFFMEQSEFTTNDETLFVRTTKQEVYISHDGGSTFKKFEADDEIVSIYMNPYFKNVVLLISASNKIYLSPNRGKNFKAFATPSELNPFGIPFVTFDPSSSNRFIFMGDEGCENQYSAGCRPVAFLTENGGSSWIPMTKDVKHCDFVGSAYTDANTNEKLIICQAYKNDKYVLVSSTDNFANQQVLFDNIVGFATTSHFTVVATVNDDSLQAQVTIDGVNFAEANFPKDFVVNKQQAYTVLGSETGAIFLHVTSNERAGSEFGAILKSNANGTSYVMSQRYVNRNEFGFVDYERVEGLEGIALINLVKNHEDAKGGAMKQLESRITFNDGSDWYYIRPPLIDSEGQKYPCIGTSMQECSLHLHGYTERKDFRDTFSSGSAVGLLLAVGNVGDKLGSFKDASTFITNDGGASWREVKKGAYQWEFGDRGSIIVLVDDSSETNVVTYSLDQGRTWNDYVFSKENVKVDDIVTVPSDTSKRFFLTTKSSGSRGEEARTFTIDFENVFARQCSLDLDHPDSDDFEYWTFSHPMLSDKCLFGHETRYLRKLADRTDCFIGGAPLGDAYKVVRQCECTRQDFECDYNYAKADDGTCKLVPGLEPEDRSEVCKIDQDAIEFFEPTGYRKIPMSNCEGGQEFDKWHPVPCPGKEGEFDKKHGGKLSGFGLALTITVPILVFIFAVWFVYDRGIRRNGGLSRFGEIRLGEEDDLIEQNNTDRVVNGVVRGGITVIAAAIATYKVAAMGARGISNRLGGMFDRGTRFHTRGAGYTTVGVNDYRDEEDILGEVLDDDDYDIEDDEDTGPQLQHDASEAYEEDRNLE